MRLGVKLLIEQPEEFYKIDYVIRYKIIIKQKRTMLDIIYYPRLLIETE